MANKKPTAKKKTPRKPRKKATKPTNITKLTVRDQKLVGLIIENIQADKPKAMKDILMEAGFAETTANSNAKGVIGKSGIQTAIQQAMRDAGITRGLLMGKVKEGLDATKVISAVIVSGKNAKGEDANPGTHDFVDVPDFMARHKYVDTALKLDSAFPNDKLDVNHTGDVNITVMDYANWKKGEK